MSIRDLGDKIKTLLLDDRIFLSLIAVLIAAVSFGLGRVSLSWQPGQGQVAQIIQKTREEPSLKVAPSSATSTEDPPTVADSGTYVGSKNSNKYHLPWCSGALRIAEGNKVWFATKEEAERAGYVPAGNCPGI